MERRNLTQWLRTDLEILRDHHDVALDRGVGKSLSDLVEHLSCMYAPVSYEKTAQAALRRLSDAEDRIADLEEALRGVMSLGYVKAGMWCVVEAVHQGDLARAREVLAKDDTRVDISDDRSAV